jgi:hypothetical protein
MTREDRRGYMKKYMKKWREEHREEHKEYMSKWRSEHREERNSRNSKRRSEHREEYNSRMRKYNSENLNKNGVTKSHIRVMSRKILEKCHAKLHGYQIHHCFGYEDPNKFLYIPKSLHLQIHQLLREKKIQSDSNHWNSIRDLVNACEEYTYIRT